MGRTQGPHPPTRDMGPTRSEQMEKRERSSTRLFVQTHNLE